MVRAVSFSLHALLLFVQEPFELGEEFVSDFLNMESFLIVDKGLILVLEFFRLHLKDVGVDLPGPEPLCTPELNTLGIWRWDVSQVLKQLFPFGAVLKTESDVGYSVCNRGNAIRNGQTLRTGAILLSRMDKVSVAALERETAGESLKALHDVHDGSINRADIHGGQGRLPLLDVTRVIDKALGFSECFHLLRPLPQISPQPETQRRGFFVSAGVSCWPSISCKLA
jgi:hypothetical protein